MKLPNGGMMTVELGSSAHPLPVELDFAFGQFDQDGSPLSVADDLVDVRDHVRRIRNHDSLACHKICFLCCRTVG